MNNGSGTLFVCPTCGRACGGRGPYHRHLQRCPKTIEELVTLTGADATNPDECWLPRRVRPGTRDRIRVGQRRAHVVAYELVYGKVLSGNVVCHTCDVPGCINPKHLWQGTQAENLQDMWLKGRGVLSGGLARG